jgi:signal transduction histidine kinase/ligand-binding sensor domain-containing protein
MLFPRSILLLLCAITMAHAAGERFLVRVWQSEDGLPGNAVRSVVQAADGYLWVATAEGLVRFDGVRFSGFGPEPDSTLSLGRVRSLFPTPDGDVFAGTDRGGLLRWHAGKMHRLLPETSAGGAGITQVIAEGGGVIALRGAEAWLVPRRGEARSVERTKDLDERLAQDAESWTEKGRLVAGASSPRLNDSAGRTWAVSASEGLIVTDLDGQSLTVLPPANRVSELCEDREGNIWVATADSGLVQVRQRRVRVLGMEDGLSDRVSLALVETRDGALWIGGKNGVVDCVRGESVQHFQVGDGSRAVAALMETRDGTLWTATRYGSVFRFDGGVFRPAFAGNIAASQVKAMAEDTGGRLWLGGFRGLAISEEGQVRSLPLPVEESEITALTATPDGAVWAGTRRGHVWRCEGVEITPLFQCRDRSISALVVDADGTLWAATLGGGLVRFRAGQMAAITTAHGLPDARLTAVLDDGAGNLWLGSLAGIFRVARSELAGVLADPRRGAARFLRLDRADGLLVRECSGLCHPSAWRRKDGSLWFSTVNGTAWIEPARIMANEVAPLTRIESVLVNGRELAAGSIAGPGSAWLDVHFTGLSFAAPEKVRFLHRLEGLDSGWRDTRERSVSYAAVPPGHYTFQVRAENGDGVLDEKGASLAIVVKPHVWETLWFRVGVAMLGALAAGMVGLAIARARWRRRMALLEVKHAREAERSRIARDLHDDLGASLTEISMLASVTAEESAAAPVRASLEEIASKAHSIVGALDEIVWAVNPRHDTLASLADYLAAFAGEFLGAAGVALRLELPRGVPASEVDTERRHALLLAVREALNNVVKHSGAREVRLRVMLPPGSLVVEVEDDGKGFDPAVARAGEGIGNLHSRLAALGGVCEITSAPGVGTKVALRLPLAIG